MIKNPENSAEEINEEEIAEDDEFADDFDDLEPDFDDLMEGDED